MEDHLYLTKTETKVNNTAQYHIQPSSGQAQNFRFFFFLKLLDELVISQKKKKTKVNSLYSFAEELCQ